MSTSETLAKALCSTFCEAITVNPVPCGFAVSAAFTDPSGDRIGFYIVAEGDGYRLEDDGEYLARLVALGIDIDKGQRQQLLESVLETAGAFWDRDTYEIKTGAFESEELTARMVRFLSALIWMRSMPDEPNTTQMMTLDQAESALAELAYDFRNDMVRQGIKELSPEGWFEMFRSWLPSAQGFARAHWDRLEWLEEIERAGR